MVLRKLLLREQDQNPIRTYGCAIAPAKVREVTQGRPILNCCCLLSSLEVETACTDEKPVRQPLRNAARRRAIANATISGDNVC
jgi:hypothetical protein